MDAAQWPHPHPHPHPQQVGGFSRPMEELAIPQIPNNNNNDMNNNTNNPPNNSRASSTTQVVGDQRRARPQKDQNLNCPRCNSTNTKFCYYNNYSLTQPRYFCKTCRRYWTQGGSLRNVPVGGGSRKNKRSSSSSSSNPSSTSNPSSIPTKIIPDLNPPSSLSHLITPSQNPKFLEGQDLNLAFPIQSIFHNNDQNHDQPINIMNITNNSNNNNNNTTTNNNNNNDNNNNNSNNSCSTTSSSTPISALDLLRSGIATRGSLNPFVPMPMPDSNTLYPSGFPNLQDFKPNLNVFSPQNDQNNMIGSGDNNAARLLFPFADMNKLASSTPTTTHHHHHHHEIDHQTNKSENDHHHNNQAPTTEYWSGMLGGGAW